MTTDSSTEGDRWMSIGVIAGIAAALVLLLTLIAVALYVHYAASPLCTIQVSCLHVSNLSSQYRQTCVTIHVWNKSGPVNLNVFTSFVLL